MIYRYETHLHTCQGSACGRTPGREYVEKYRKLGYAGIFVTDHFFEGNCAVDRSLPWREKVDAYMEGYRDAKREGDRVGFPVFFGIEQNYEGDEYLIYGVDAEFLYGNPEIERWPHTELVRCVREYGGCVIQAHPFRERSYIDRIRLFPCGVDGVEAVNMGNRPEEDALALRYARRLNLPATAGSDNHCADKMTEDNVCATGTTRPIVSERDFARYVRGREPLFLCAPDGRGEWTEGAAPTLPVDVLDAESRVVGHDANTDIRA